MTVAFAGTERFAILREIGAGGMGAVYEAIDRDHGVNVALKRLHAATPQSLVHMRREFRALEAVRHENLVSLFELLEADGQLFFTMELLDGVDLLTYVRAANREYGNSGVTATALVNQPAAPGPRTRARADDGLDVARLRDALVQLARGLAALHAIGKVHRDIKPSNVRVTSDGRVVLLDFGLAIEQATNQGSTAGTRAFMAPEQAAGGRVTAAADAYAVGVVLFLALTGELPFRGAEIDRKRANHAAPRVRAIAPDAPDDLASLCDDLLALDPAARPTADDVLRRLGASPSARTIRAAPFVGRRAEIDALIAAVDASREGATVTVVVGDSGVGKTALVRELVSAIEGRALVLASRCYERELLAYNAFDGIVEALSEHLRAMDPRALARIVPPDAAMLARVFPLLRRVGAFADAPDESATPLQRRARAFAALRALLDALARDRLLVLSIDDLQWADADSIVLMNELLEAPAPRLAIVATMRPATDAAGVLAGARFDTRTIPLAPLADADARKLVDAALGPDADASVAAAIARESAGHPLFLLTLAHHADEREARAVKLEDAIWSRIEGLDGRARRLLEIVAIAGEPLAASAGAAASSMDRAAYARASDALRVARLTRSAASDEIEPYHDRVRETVLARIDDATRRDCHARIAAAIESGGADSHPESLVRHLAGAGETERAAVHAVRAAKRAFDALAFDQAAALYRMALDFGAGDDTWRREQRVALAETLASAGRGAESADVYLACADGANADDRIEHQRRAADHLIRSGHVERGLAILSDVLTEYGERVPRSMPAALIAMLAPRLLPRVRHLRWERRDERAIDRARLRRLDVFHAVSVSLCLVDTARGGAFQSRSVALALKLGEPLRVGRTLTLEACYVASTGSRGLTRARQIHAEVARIAASTRDPYLLGCTLMVDAFIDYHAGAFRSAIDKFVEGERAFRVVPGSYFEGGFCQWFRLVALRNRGMFGEIDRRYEEWTRDAERRGDRFNEAAIRLNLNGVWLARDDVEGARRELGRIHWSPPVQSFHLQHWYEAAARAEIALYERDASGLARFRDVRRRLARTFIPRMRIHRATSNWVFARLLLASGARADLAEAEKMAKALGAEDVAFARVWSHLAYAAIARRRGDDAAPSLRDAIARATESHLEQYATAARARLGAILGGTEGAALREEARAWLEAQNVARPERMLDVWAPGFF